MKHEVKIVLKTGIMHERKKEKKGNKYKTMKGNTTLDKISKRLILDSGHKNEKQLYTDQMG